MWQELTDNPVARIVAVVGAAVETAPSPWRAVRVHCGGPQSTLRPIQEAIRRIDTLTGERAVWSAGRLRRGLRGTLLGEQAESGLGAMVASLNRLSQGDTPRAIIFERIELADAATLGVLRQLTDHPGWLRPVLVLTLAQEPTDAVLSAILANAERDGPAVAEPEPVTIASMPAEARRSIRAAAIIGAGFELSLLSELLELDPIRVLESLQAAHDAGVILEDLGEGRFQMAPEVAAALTTELLPSLRQAWHHRLAALIHPPEDRVLVSPPMGETVDVEPEGEAKLAELDVVDVEPVSIERTVEVAAPQDTGRARAAAHLGAAGEVVAAVEEYLAAAGEVEPIATHSAVAWGEEALALVAALMPERTDLLRRIRTVLGAIKLAGCSPHGSFSLGDALADLEVARSLLDARTPPDQHADLLALLAAAWYDRGDSASLKLALSGLTGAMKIRSESGDVIGAARLLNEQAAVWIRIGDSARASKLLRESRRLFSRLSHPDAAIERAETDHILARLPLHARSRAGSADAAITRALEHAAEARQGYARLGNIREIARIDETVGRLELSRGALSAAKTALESAITTQRRIGELTGLARSTSAMAEVLRLSGRAEEALALLTTSIQLNAARGSILGLRLNREGLAALSSQPGAASVRSILDQAEAMVGTPGGGGVQ
ncbi:MAG: tetratricopeptide (TPR) repeat protein [Myxococcota bacterium]|jgi:tetratricopeptide (TPR) repeat protein